MKKEKYIRAVLSHVANSVYYDEIRRELSDHIEDRAQYFTDMGYDKETAEKMAVEKMGSADDAGAQFGKLNCEYYLACFGAAVMLLAFIINLFIFFSEADVEKLLFYHTISLKEFLINLGTLNIPLIPISLFGIIESSILFTLCYKYRLRKPALIGGCTYIAAGLILPFLYMPFTYGAVGFFTDYLGEIFFKPELCFNEIGNLTFTDFNFLNSRLGEGASIWIKSEKMLDIIYYATAIFVILSALLPFVMGISMIIMYSRMTAGKAIDGRKKHIKHLLNLISAFVIIGGIFINIELVTPTVQLRCEQYKASKAFEQEADDMTEFALELFDNPTENYCLRLLDKYGFTYAYSPVDSLNRSHLTVAPTENFDIGIGFYDGELNYFAISLRKFSIDGYAQTLDDIDTTLSMTETIKKYTFRRIIRFDFYHSHGDTEYNSSSLTLCDEHHAYNQYYDNIFHAEYIDNKISEFPEL